MMFTQNDAINTLLGNKTVKVTEEEKPYVFLEEEQVYIPASRSSLHVAKTVLDGCFTKNGECTLRGKLLSNYSIEVQVRHEGKWYRIEKNKLKGVVQAWIIDNCWTYKRKRYNPNEPTYDKHLTPQYNRFLAPEAWVTDVVEALYRLVERQSEEY